MKEFWMKICFYMLGIVGTMGMLMVLLITTMFVNSWWNLIVVPIMSIGVYYVLMAYRDDCGKLLELYKKKDISKKR